MSDQRIPASNTKSRRTPSRLFILDDSSDTDSFDLPDLARRASRASKYRDIPTTRRKPRPLGYACALSDSSDSFDERLESFLVKPALTSSDEEKEDKDDIASPVEIASPVDLTVAKSHKKLSAADAAIDLTDNDNHHDADARTQEDEEEDIPGDIQSAWKIDNRSDECYFDSEDGSFEWPDFRVPRDLYDRLYDYQRTGVQWMVGLHVNRIGGILGDDMGMGKTYMTLTSLGGLMRAKTIQKALVIVPVSVLRSWENEAHMVLKKCVPNARIQVLSSSGMSVKQRSRTLQDALFGRSSQPLLMITTFGLVRSSTNDFCGDSHDFWDYVVLDEGHQIKNHASESSLACRKVCRNPETHRLLLTGTPIMNNLTELWALFDWATSQQVLGDRAKFNLTFAKTIESARDMHASEGVIQLGQRANTQLQGLLKPYFLQRLKIDFLKDKLPEKTDLVVWIHLSTRQRELYQEYVEAGDSVVRRILSGELTSPLQGITWLKKLCAHPLIAENLNDGVDAHLMSLHEEQLIEQSEKLGVLYNLIEKLRANGHRTLIFSQSTKMLDIIQKTLGHIPMGRIDGSTKERDRQRVVDDFNSDDSSLEAMLLSTKAAGLGITLTGADRVIVYDPSWTPAEDAQAIDRCYRIGQKRNVVVFRLISAGTVEEKMYEKQIHKDGIRRTVLTEGVQVERYFDRSELSKLFSLSPPGICDVLEKTSERTMQMDWGPFESVIQMKGVVGLSRHDNFYHKEDDGESDKVNTFTGTRPTKKSGLGRSQRALHQEANQLEALGRKKRAPKEKALQGLPVVRRGLSDQGQMLDHHRLSSNRRLSKTSRRKSPPDAAVALGRQPIAHKHTGAHKGSTGKTVVDLSSSQHTGDEKKRASLISRVAGAADSKSQAVAAPANDYTASISNFRSSLGSKRRSALKPKCKKNPPRKWLTKSASLSDSDDSLDNYTMARSNFGDFTTSPAAETIGSSKTNASVLLNMTGVLSDSDDSVLKDLHAFGATSISSGEKMKKKSASKARRAHVPAFEPRPRSTGDPSLLFVAREMTVGKENTSLTNTSTSKTPGPGVLTSKRPSASLASPISINNTSRFRDRYPTNTDGPRPAVHDILHRAQEHTVHGRKRRAVQLLVGTIETDYHKLTRSERMEVHQQLAPLADSMGLLSSSSD